MWSPFYVITPQRQRQSDALRSRSSSTAYTLSHRPICADVSDFDRTYRSELSSNYAPRYAYVLRSNERIRALLCMLRLILTYLSSTIFKFYNKVGTGKEKGPREVLVSPTFVVIRIWARNTRCVATPLTLGPTEAHHDGVPTSTDAATARSTDKEVE